MIRRLLLTGIGAAVVAVLAHFAEIPVSFLPAKAPLYPAAAIEAAFGAWFGLWGCLASYLGFFVAGVSAGWFTPPSGTFLSLGDCAIPLLTAAAVRVFGIDPSLRKAKSAFAFLLFAMLGSITGSLWYNLIELLVYQRQSWNSFWPAVAGWNLANLIVFLLIALPLMYVVTPIVKKFHLFLEDWI